MFVDLKKQYKASLKSADTEEGIDLAFYRPIGFAWAYLFRKLGITPNMVTIASIFLGIGAGVCFFYEKWWINVIGIILLIWANSFDSADGQLARMTKQYSALGRILDGLSGDIWFFSIYFAICLRITFGHYIFDGCEWLIWIIAAVAGVCHAKQAAMADHYRQFHLLMVNGKSELDDTAELRQRLAALSWRKNFWRKATLTFYTGYTANQEATAPTLQRLRSELAARFPEGLPSERFRADFRSVSLPLMKYTNALTFNWRTIFLFFSIGVGQPWLYFAAEITVFNILLIYMVRRHEAICRQALADLASGKYDK